LNDESRPQPEEILARITERQSAIGAGRLKIFLGMAAGVGKTYAMLEAARSLKREGTDVVAGLIVTHGRKDTEVLSEGLEIIPELEIEYKGALLREFNLDEALKRRPQVLLLDELAHTNAPGSRHEKRWQDIEELMLSGIDVYTTLNIQHLESVNDLIAQVTGVMVRETIPDSVFEKATDIELVDLAPDDLIQRLREGKIYIPEHAKSALENFFKKGNLIALRELALRLAAERVDAQMQRYREETRAQEVWPVADRILVCVGPSPLSGRLVRAGKRMAVALNGKWFAVYVETPGSARLSDKDRHRVIRTLALAQRLGAQTDRISGRRPSEELVSYARRNNISRIVIGKPARARWREVLLGSVVDELIRKSGHIDVYVISGDKTAPDTSEKQFSAPKLNIKNYFFALLLVGLASLIAKLTFRQLASVNLAMIYQLAVVIIALNYGRGPSTLAAILSVFLFDYFFVPPYLSFAVSDTQYLITFVVMLTVALSLSTLTSRLKTQAELSRNRERQTTALYMMTRDQATAMGADNVCKLSAKHIADVFECQVAVLLADSEGKLVSVPLDLPVASLELDSKEMGVAHWVHLNKQPAGATTATLAGAKALYLPMIGSGGAIGVIAVIPSVLGVLGNPDEMHLLETFVNQTALAVERAQLGERRRAARA
jgi:two-component system, OmpR family, sensor histidine kinase KdpD